MEKGNVTLENCYKIWGDHFGNLDPQKRRQLEKQTISCGYEKSGQLNMNDFFTGKKIWILRKGVLHVVMHGEAGKTLVLFKITPDNSGFVLPEGCLDFMMHNIEIVSAGQSEICYIPELLSSEIYREDSDVRRWQGRQYMKIFSKLLEMISDLSFLSLYERLLKRLQEYCRDNCTWVIRVTHEQLAEELATSREVVSRLLKRMEAEQVIRIERKSIYVLEERIDTGDSVLMVG